MAVIAAPLAKKVLPTVPTPVPKQLHYAAPAVNGIRGLVDDGTYQSLVRDRDMIWMNSSQLAAYEKAMGKPRALTEQMLLDATRSFRQRRS